MRVIAAALGVLVVVGVAVAGTIPGVTVLPKPGFPAPAKDVKPTGARLVLVSSAPHDAATLPPERPEPPPWAPRRFKGDDLQAVIRQGGKLFFLYGPDAASGRHLLGADARTQEIRYAFDFTAFASPPHGGWFEPVTWAREVGRTLYVSNSHLTYASTTKGRNAYVSAIDLRTRTTLWRSHALVANARTFIATAT